VATTRRSANVSHHPVVTADPTSSAAATSMVGTVTITENAPARSPSVGTAVAVASQTVVSVR
jgi:hypothetical protein